MALNLPDANKVPGDANHTDDTNLIIEAINTLKSEVDGIPAGPTGAKGDPGNDGAPGQAATITVGSTTTGAAGTSAAVTNDGDEYNAVLNFTIPRGATGATGAAGSQGPQGPKGDQGDRGPTGYGVIPGGTSGYILAKASNADYDTQWIAAGAAPPVDSVDGRTGAVTLSDLYDAAGSASTAQSNAQSYADSAVSTHNSDTTGVHGIPDTSLLATVNDSRFTDERTPLDNSVTSAKIVDGAIVDADINAAAGIAPTKINGTAVVDSDSRLTDARTPTSHASSHGSGGSDAITIAPSQVTGTAVVDSDSRLTDARTPTAHAASHTAGGSDEITVAQSQVTNLSTDLAAKAPLASPTFTGTPAAPTAAQGTNTTQLATTAYVQTELGSVDALPSQTGNSGKYLTTDGSTASWAEITTDPTPAIFFLGGM